MTKILTFKLIRIVPTEKAGDFAHKHGFVLNYDENTSIFHQGMPNF